MEITDLLILERIDWNAQANSKVGSLKLISDLFAKHNSQNFSQTTIFDCLFERERLSNTGMGAGIALPHGRLATNTETLGAFIKLQTPIDFDASDQQPVDLLFALLVPEHSTNEHVYILSCLGNLFKDPVMCEKLRQATNSKSALALINEWETVT